MNQFERTAIFTAIDVIEAQIRGLKSLIAAAGGNSKVVHPQNSSTPFVPVDEFATELNDREEAELEKAIKSAQEAEIARMQGEAEQAFKKLYSEVQGASEKLNG